MTTAPTPRNTAQPCDAWRDRVADLACGELPDAHAADALAHTHACPACADALAQWHAAAALVARAAGPDPTTNTNTNTNAIADAALRGWTPPALSTPRPHQRATAARLALAASLLLAFVLGYTAGRGSPPNASSITPNAASRAPGPRLATTPLPLAERYGRATKDAPDAGTLGWALLSIARRGQ